MVTWPWTKKRHDVCYAESKQSDICCFTVITWLPHIHGHPFNGLFSQNNLHEPAPEKLNESGFQWSKRWWDGSGISWTICKSFAPCYRQTTMPAPHHSISDRPDANQQCQDTEGNNLNALQWVLKYFNSISRNLVQREHGTAAAVVSSDIQTAVHRW